MCLRWMRQSWGVVLRKNRGRPQEPKWLHFAGLARRVPHQPGPMQGAMAQRSGTVLGEAWGVEVWCEGWKPVNVGDVDWWQTGALVTVCAQAAERGIVTGECRRGSASMMGSLHVGEVRKWGRCRPMTS